MIELVQAKSMIMLKTSGNAKAEVIDKIYDSRGTCAECEHFNDRYKKKDICFIDGNLHKPTHFCGYFERKDN